MCTAAYSTAQTDAAISGVASVAPTTVDRSKLGMTTATEISHTWAALMRVVQLIETPK